MSSKIKLLLIFSSFVLIAAFAYFFVARRTIAPPPSDTKALIESVQKQPSPAAPQATSPTPTPASNAAPAPAANRAPAPPPDPLVQLKSDLLQLSSVFAERWGSYSNQQDVSNIRTLLPFMTAAMQTYALSQERAQIVTQADPSVYLGVRTKALNVKEQQFDPSQGSASYVVTTQRVQMQGTGGNTKVFYQELDLRMTKEEGMWKVSGAYWRQVEAD
ncbi:MAG: hypothetical protein WC659_04520 [Patescibacteria group bacterium]